MWRFTLKQFLVAICFVAVLGSMSSHWMRTRVDRRCQQTMWDFHHLGIIMHNHFDAHGRLPDPVARSLSGEELYSWRFTVAEEHEDPSSLMPRSYSAQYDKAWTGSANARMRNLPGYSYVFADRKTPQQPRDFHTNIFAITGPGTAFGGAEIDLNDPPPAILAVEVLNSGTHWMEPGDFDVRIMPKTINSGSGRDISSRYSGVHVLFADGSVWFVSDRVPFETLSKFFVVDAAANLDPEKLLGPYRIP